MRSPRENKRLLLIASLALLLVTLPGCTLLNKDPVIRSIDMAETQLKVTESSIIVAVASDPDGDELSYEWTASGGNISSRGPIATWTAPSTPGSYTIDVTVMDTNGSQAQMTMNLSIPPNSTPVINSLVPEREVANPGESIAFQCNAFDGDGDILNYSWSASDGSFLGSGPVTSWIAPYGTGTYQVSVEVSDGKGGKATDNIAIDVSHNNPPVIESLTAGSASILQLHDTTVNCVANDPDGGELFYFWETSSGDITGEGPEVIWTAPQECATHQVMVTVIDDRGGQANRNLNIRVRSPGG